MINVVRKNRNIANAINDKRNDMNAEFQRFVETENHLTRVTRHQTNINLSNLTLTLDFFKNFLDCNI